MDLQIVKEAINLGGLGFVAVIALILLDRAHKEKAKDLDQIRNEHNTLTRDLTAAMIRHTEVQAVLAEKISELPDRLMERTR